VKLNAMPESVTDRPSSSVEYVFLLSKSERYYWDADGGENAPASMLQGILAVEACHGWAMTNYVAANNHKGKPYVASAGRSRRNADWARVAGPGHRRLPAQLAQLEHVRDNGGLLLGEDGEPLGLLLATEGFPEAHFATFGERVRRAIHQGWHFGARLLPSCGRAVEEVVDENAA